MTPLHNIHRRIAEEIPDHIKVAYSDSRGMGRRARIRRRDNGSFVVDYWEDFNGRWVQLARYYQDWFGAGTWAAYLRNFDPRFDGHIVYGTLAQNA